MNDEMKIDYQYIRTHHLWWVKVFNDRDGIVTSTECRKSDLNTVCRNYMEQYNIPVENILYSRPD